VLILVALVLIGCGDQKAKDRAAAEKASAEAYRVRQDANAMATAVAVNAETQTLAVQALATQSALNSQIQATSAAIEHQALMVTNGQPVQQAASGGWGIVDLAPIVAMFVTVGLAGGSFVVSLATARRQSQEPQIVYVRDGDQGARVARPVVSGTNGPLLPAKTGYSIIVLNQGRCRILAPGESQARRMLSGG